MKKGAADMWNSDFGILRKVKTTALGNCFFFALHVSGQLSFKSESDARFFNKERVDSQWLGKLKNSGKKGFLGISTNGSCGSKFTTG